MGATSMELLKSFIATVVAIVLALGIIFLIGTFPEAAGLMGAFALAWITVHTTVDKDE